MWIAVILIAGFVAWHFLPNAKPQAASPQFRGDLRAKADDPQWQSIVEEHTESPAEAAFLRAMVRSFQLLSRIGCLVGQGLKLDLQVREGPYRVDFLADEWLVIEIDGAAWHSSPEAQVRDRARDDYFEDLGYTVLRIPAKVVLNNPVDAVQRVRTALAIGKRKIETPLPVSGFKRMGQTLSAISKGLNDINSHVATTRAVRSATNEVRLAFEIERKVLDTALDSARRSVEIAEYLNGNDKIIALYNKSKQELEEAFRKYDNNSTSNRSIIHIPSYSTPSMHEDPSINILIEAEYAKLRADRANYLSDIRQHFEGDPRLVAPAMSTLKKLGCEGVWSTMLREASRN